MFWTIKNDFKLYEQLFKKRSNSETGAKMICFSFSNTNQFLCLQFYLLVNSYKNSPKIFIRE